MAASDRLIYILRHAKAESYDNETDDLGRALNQDGREGAALVGRYLAQHHSAPDRVLCSPSLRTRQTWEIVAQETGWRPSVELPQQLYLASTGALFEFIQNLPESAKSVMVVGHNPGLHDFCLRAADDPHHPLYQALSLKFPPGSLAVFAAFVPTWQDVAPGRLRLLANTKPSALA